MKNNLIFKIAIATLICFGASFLIAKWSGINRDEHYPVSLFKRYAPEFKCKPDSQATSQFAKKFESRDIHEIEFNIVSANLEILPSTSGEIEVSYGGASALDLSDQVTGNVLMLSEHNQGGSDVLFNCGATSDHGFHFSFDSSEGKKIILRIPKQVQKIGIHSTSGDLIANGISLDDLKIEAISGDLRFENLQVKDLGLKTVSGDQHINGDWGQGSFKSVSGDLNIETSNPTPKIGMQSTSGDIHLSLKKTVNATIHAMATSGDFAMTGEKSIESDELRSGISKTLGAGAGTIAIKTISGDMAITLK